MPSVQRESLEIDRLLADLHRKKRWLDTVIAGLERAMDSPEVQFINAVETAFQDDPLPLVDLSDEGASLLVSLAARVPQQRQHSQEEAPQAKARRSRKRPLTQELNTKSVSVAPSRVKMTL